MQNTKNKTIFLKSDKIGEGELGSMLIKGFLNVMIENDKLPKEIICVNNAVFLTTTNDEVVALLTQLEKKGVLIYSCGTCLDFYNLKEQLKVGTIGNAVDTVTTLLSKDIVTL